MVVDFKEISSYIIGFESFTPKAFWDHKQYTYGYGTKSPTPTATITKEDAFLALTTRIKTDTTALQALAKKPLTSPVLKALTSFAFNCGLGAARAMVSDINNGKTLHQVGERMKLYRIASGKVNNGLIARRSAEVKTLLS